MVAARQAFEQALLTHPAPRTLGDVHLRYEPSMLIGETARRLRSLWPTLAWLVGLGSTLGAVVAIAFQAHDLLSGALVLLAGASWLTTVQLERLDKRRRAFIVNFTTSSLRLDFVTPFAGRPRTLIVHFDGVRAVELAAQADGLSCLTVDFVPTPDSKAVLREVLAAFIPAAQADEAARLQRVLEGAFALREPPPEPQAVERAVDDFR